jgi:type III pantothenate kinase
VVPRPQGLITRTTLATVEAVAVACTVPAILVEIRAMIERYYADAPSRSSAPA